jgi:hypothetical protein
LIELGDDRFRSSSRRIVEADAAGERGERRVEPDIEVVGGKAA